MKFILLALTLVSCASPIVNSNRNPSSTSTLTWSGDLALTDSCRALALKKKDQRAAAILCPPTAPNEMKSDCLAFVWKKQIYCKSQDCMAIMAPNQGDELLCSSADSDCFGYIQYQKRKCQNCFNSGIDTDALALAQSKANLCRSNFCRALVLQKPELCDGP